MSDSFGRSKKRDPEEIRFSRREKHRNAYHRYFENYTEKKVPRKNGKGTRIVRVYTGEYYKHEMPDDEWKKLKIVYGLSYLLAVAALILGMSRNALSNYTKFMALLGMIAILMSGWILFVLLSYLPAGRKLTIGEFKATNKPLITASLAGAISMGILSLSSILSLIFVKDVGYELFNAAIYALGGLLLLLIWRKENKIQYERVPNENCVPKTEEDFIM